MVVVVVVYLMGDTASSIATCFTNGGVVGTETDGGGCKETELIGVVL